MKKLLIGLLALVPFSAFTMERIQMNCSVSGVHSPYDKAIVTSTEIHPDFQSFAFDLYPHQIELSSSKDRDNKITLVSSPNTLATNVRLNRNRHEITYPGANLSDWYGNLEFIRGRKSPRKVRAELVIMNPKATQESFKGFYRLELNCARNP